jgi:hypothetical protein
VKGILHDEAACKGFERIFSCTFSLERKSTKKFKHGGGYNTAVHTP